MLQWLWCWFALISRLSEIYSAHLIHDGFIFRLFRRRVIYTTAVQIRPHYVSQLKTIGRAGALRAAHQRKGSTRSEGEKQNMPLDDLVAIVAEVYGTVYQLYLIL